VREERIVVERMPHLHPRITDPSVVEPFDPSADEVQLETRAVVAAAFVPIGFREDRPIDGTERDHFAP